MSDFRDPKYANYVQLCRELKLEHAWQAGDQFGYESEHNQTGVALQDIALRGLRDWWLPTLADWLEMLEAVGALSVVLSGAWNDDYENGTRCYIATWQGHNAFGPTREEAVARLWMTITCTEPASTS